MNSTQKSWLKDLLFLTLIISLVYGAFLGSRPLMVPDEGRYAEISREMLSTGTFLTPHLNGIKYFEKPPLFYWIERLSMQWFGVNQWSLRLMPMLIGLAGILAVYSVTRKLYNRTCAFLAALILASSALYVTMSHFVNPDLTLTVCLSISLLCFILGTQNLSHKSHTYYFLSMYGFAALATLTKGLIGIVFPGLIILVWICLFNQWRQLKHYCMPLGIGLFLAISIPWHLAVQIINPEFFKFYFVDQHILRYLTDSAQRTQPLWFFPVAVAVGFFPWISFYLTAIRLPKLQLFKTLNLAWQQKNHHKITGFFVIWLLVIFLFFTLSHSLLLSYALPTLPPLAILLACYLAPYWHNPITPKKIAAGFTLFSLLGLGFSLAGLLAIHPQSIGPFNKIYWYLSLALLAASSLLTLIAYRIKGFKAGFITLFFSINLCLISVNFSYPTIDNRSIKSLAVKLKPLLTSSTEVAVYHQYLQDLPVYIGRTVTVVGYEGELAFGMQHQDTQAWMINDATFWKRWQNSPRMYMIMNLKFYMKHKDVYPTMYPLAQTHQNILLTNKPPD